MGAHQIRTVKRRKTKGETMKTRKPNTKHHHPHPAIESLPGDLLNEVLVRVASSSFTDLFNVKLCCRDFLGAADNDYILEHISIEKFPVIHWFTRDEVISFLNRCKDRGNPEALYRQGMVEYFSYMRMELGLQYLKRAAEKGHTDASYVYGIILLSRGDEESTQHGLELLNSLKISSKSRSLRLIRECRERTKAIIRLMWITNYIIRHDDQLSTCCPEKDRACMRRKLEESWSCEEDEDEVTCCDSCRWDGEVNSFCKMLRGEY